jgi:hypothetical protein
MTMQHPDSSRVGHHVGRGRGERHGELGQIGALPGDEHGTAMPVRGMEVVRSRPLGA